MNRLRVCFNYSYQSGLFAQISFLFLVLLAVPGLTAQVPWSAIGPEGGDARAFAAVPGQPHHLYLGTTNSWLYESLDGGSSWHRLSKLDAADDLILDHIVVDAANPATLYVAAWKLDHPGGGLWVSRDGGRSWGEVAALRGQSIRAFTQAPSNPAMLIAGTLKGVFRSTDAGATWTQISPPGSKEIHEVESLAIDPTDTDVVYAGTWHLPWKTTDGGNSWSNIKHGVIDDSDVFSIIIDPAEPKIIFASACSGIYKSVNGAELFKKIEGIPDTARRTRVLKQDPGNRDVVYAGTTEGLYKTLNGGKSFERMTGPDVIVNDVFVDPGDTNHVLLATDRGGVLLSQDAGVSFVEANGGFSGRKVEALLVASGSPARLFAGVVNDKSYGGVFVSTNGGAHWEQIDNGLDGRDVFALAESPDGTILAGTNHGIFALAKPDKADKDAAATPGASADPPAVSWIPRGTIENTLVETATEIHDGKRVTVERRVKDAGREIDGRVRALDLSGDAWLASTSGGLFSSVDHGATWQGGPVMGSVDYLSVAAHGSKLVAARRDGAVLSTDAGESWMPIGIPAMLTRIHCVAFSADGTLWLGAREGVYFSRDLGKTWLWVHRLPLNDVDDLTYDDHLGQILVSSRLSDQVFAINPKTLEWKFAQTGYHVNLVRAAAGRLLAASMFDGVVVEPEKTGTSE
ncbi:MAG: transcriptional regulator [Terracidiphilus sp.]|jgi:photosystem II stability/assembly factor-like uncharacterized protein